MRFTDSILPWLTGVMMLVSLWLIFMVVPNEASMGFVQRIFGKARQLGPAHRNPSAFGLRHGRRQGARVSRQDHCAGRQRRGSAPRPCGDGGRGRGAGSQRSYNQRGQCNAQECQFHGADFA